MKEEDIRKRDVFDHYLAMVEDDVRHFFNFDEFGAVGCPACGSGSWRSEFTKNGFTYVSCASCETLYVNPRPPFSVLDSFYSASPSSSYWVNEFFKPVAEIRREKIFRPRAEYVAGLTDRNGQTYADVGAGFGLFLEELRALKPDNRFVAIEPSEEMALICRDKGLHVEQTCLEDMDGGGKTFDVITAFELLEHVYDPAAFVRSMYDALSPGGKLVLTTLNGQGFDILVLWEHSKSVFPPHHLNFFNPCSLEMLMRRSGFAEVVVETPGKLDWDIVEGAINKERRRPGRFWEFFARRCDAKTKSALQEFFVTHGLSSHMRVTATKPKA